MSKAATRSLQDRDSALRTRLVELYDELAEIVSLNFFLYDAFTGMVAEEERLVDINSLTGLASVCRGLRRRQLLLKASIGQLCTDLEPKKASH